MKAFEGQEILVGLGHYSCCHQVKTGWFAVKVRSVRSRFFPYLYNAVSTSR